MRFPIPRQRTGAHDADGLRCAQGCTGVQLDAQGLVKTHRAWYEGGRRTCYGSGQKPKGSAR
jgi:hypothetical protein